MERADLDTYIRRFNEEDAGAFEDYMAPVAIQMHTHFEVPADDTVTDLGIPH